MEVEGKQLPDATAWHCLMENAAAGASPPCDEGGWRMKECIKSRLRKDVGL